MRITIALCFLGAVCRGTAPVLAMAEDPSGWIGPANNAFAIELYEKLAAGERGNLFFSPNGIEAALTMTYAGARGETAAQMAAVLHLPPGSENIHKDFGAFISDLNGAGSEKGKERGYELSVANALWGQTGFHFLPGFVSVLRSDYGAGLEEVDFEHDPEGARRAINAWAGKQTHDKITDLVGPGALRPLTALVLANAIYFKGTWSAPFEKSATRDEAFHLSANVEKQAPMMRRMGEYGYLEGGDFQALEIEYAGGRLSMIILLPRRADGLGRLEKELTASSLSDWFGKLDEKEVAVSIPKFRMTEAFELGPTLESMGMPEAFDPGGADFSGMTGRKDLSISNVIHKAFVAVDEEGTEAAAATAVNVMGMAVMQPQTVFRADHPFLFFIQDKESGAILFMGRVMEPNQGPAGPR